MFTRKKRNTEPTLLEREIAHVHSQLAAVDSADSEEYARMATNLDRLYKMREQDAPRRVSPDVLATVTANLAGIALIVGHERAHVLTSKALGLLPKLR